MSNNLIEETSKLSSLEIETLILSLVGIWENKIIDEIGMYIEPTTARAEFEDLIRVWRESIIEAATE